MDALKHILILTACIVLTISTLFIPVNVPNKLAMSSIELGYPFHYYSQNLSALDPPLYPRKYPLRSPWEYPFEVSKAKFIGDVFVYLLLFESIIYGVNFAFTKTVLSPNK